LVYELVIGYGIASIFLGIIPALLIALKKFKLNGKLWLSFLLGGLFWGGALLARLYPLYLFATISELQPFMLFISALFAGIFETAFRVLLLLIFTKVTANSKEKVIMAGIGWGVIEAFVLHTIPVFQIILLPPENELFTQLEGVEWAILFGGFERMIVEAFHLALMILVFYGVKDRLKNIEQSKPLIKNIFTKDPKPVWIWILIVMFIHFAFDFIFISLAYTIDILLLYMLMAVLVGILMSYTSNRKKYYPLFPKEDSHH